MTVIAFQLLTYLLIGPKKAGELRPPRVSSSHDPFVYEPVLVRST
jgi:hypothetical protein